MVAEKASIINSETGFANKSWHAFLCRVVDNFIRDWILLQNSFEIVVDILGGYYHTNECAICIFYGWLKCELTTFLVCHITNKRSSRHCYFIYNET